MANKAGEFSLLAGLSQHPESYFEIQQFLSVDDFTDSAHKDYYIVLQRLLLESKQQKIIVTKPALLAEASTIGLKNFYSTCRDGELIEACLEHCISKEDTLKAFAQVKRETIKKQYSEFLKLKLKYVSETSESTNDIINNIDSSLINLSNKIQSIANDDIINLAERARSTINELASHPGELGLDIGFPIWQRAIGGLRNGSITFMAASAKQGKSMLGLRAALELSQYLPVLYCDSELNETVQEVRAVGMFSEINYRILETGYWKCDNAKIIADGYNQTFATECRIARNILEDETIWNKFKTRKLFYKKMTGMTAREVLPFLRRWVMQHAGLDNTTKIPRCLIVWDYIKLSRIDEVKTMGVGAHDILGDTCMALHDFAEDYNLPILAFGQTNRQIDMDLNMIAGAKKITELVDSISVFKKKDSDDLTIDPNGTHEIHILASRHGEGISTHINIKANLGIGKFEEVGVSNISQNTNNNVKDKDNDDSE